MAGPWEAFQPQEAGPWAQFAAQPQTNSVADFLRSIPRGMVSGLVNATSGPVIPESPVPQPPELMGGNQSAVMQAIENRTGQMHQPQTAAGKFGAAIGETLGNPLSYAGPGGLPLKIGGAVLAGAGSEAGRQIAEGTPLEIPAQLVGGLAGGIAAGKAIGPRAVEAAIPSYKELKGAAKADYNEALASGLKVEPKAIGDFALQKQQELLAAGHDPDIKTFKLLTSLQNAPEGSFTSAANLDTLRKYLGRMSRETEPAAGGTVKQTENAAAASSVLSDFNKFVQDLPKNSVVAGNAESFVRATKQGNQNYIAASQVKDAENRIRAARVDYEGSIAGRLDSKLKNQFKSILKNDAQQRGLNEEQLSAINTLNKGTVPSTVLGEIGRYGSGVIPNISHVTAALASGGATLPIWAGAYLARKAAERLALSKAREIRDIAAQRSPLYQQRVGALLPVDVSPNVAAAVRGLLGGL